MFVLARRCGVRWAVPLLTAGSGGEPGAAGRGRCCAHYLQHSRTRTMRAAALLQYHRAIGIPQPDRTAPVHIRSSPEEWLSPSSGKFVGICFYGHHHNVGLDSGQSFMSGKLSVSQSLSLSAGGSSDVGPILDETDSVKPGNLTGNCPPKFPI